MDLINDLILQAAASAWLLPIMFTTAAIDGIFPPIPSETVLVAAAAVAASAGSPVTIAALCVAAALGAWVGDNITYAVGRRIGTTRFSWMRRPRIAAAFDGARRGLGQRGAPLILGARYIPVGRVVVNLSAGALHYRWSRFLSLSALAAITWALYGAGIGVLAGHWLHDQPLLSAAVGVVVAVLTGLLIDRVAAARRRRSQHAAPPAGTTLEA